MIKKWNNFINESSGTQSTTPQGGVAYATKGSVSGMGAIKNATVKEALITEDDGGAGAGAGGNTGGSSNSTSTPVSTSGVAYVNQGNVGGMGAVKNSTVSSVPGDPNFSEAGSGDVSVPAFTYTKNTGITGNKFHKNGKMKIDKKFLQKAQQVKDKLGISKPMSFKEFSKNN